jgi:hypothetical protein
VYHRSSPPITAEVPRISGITTKEKGRDMAYRVEFPPDLKKEPAQIPSRLSLPKNTGDTGDIGDTGDGLTDGPIVAIENTGNMASAIDPTEGRIIAVMVASEVLGADIWLALDDDFKADDGLAVFYADELPLLTTKEAEMLRRIHEAKLVNGPGSRVRQ